MDQANLARGIRAVMPNDERLSWFVAYTIAESGAMTHLRVGDLLTHNVRTASDFGEMIANMTAMLSDYASRMEGRIAPEQAKALRESIERTLEALTAGPPGVPP